ncbi:LOW QUALITY PROTEIN: Hypothetical protein PHPALM_496 [Phytophthora palmivora]|uniref:Tc1-like transposase DDE domain-containing protein n=1 Tax=Phytophthora palmivora TaxID=4796 RepID=A0A2P4YUM9_9STRA|nr:LOW QUALITY PROTEIN: Hypothetical protein PHPALM_496 [Phytophthora palmivora]
MDLTLPHTREHKVARLVFAERLSTAAQRERMWPMIIFSDENIFNLDGPDGYKHYWRDLRRPPRRYMARQNEGRPWWCGEPLGKSGLVVLEGRQNSGHYIYTVSEHMLPFDHSNDGTDFVFMQDNEPIHASNETKEFIEILGKVYKRGKQYSSASQLRSAVMETWDSVTMKELQDSVDL